ncbi:5'-methylthioadenosine/S-adenosylhomocysteine nucleosidase-like [Rutidosis leptorrhynchoides]|uniref:5'-methylthioadenosine/S-adenosylhomocysteine nucleosidase-like n=1 Tax=Rutidosis leptorrhynchoides TaxID=125765 RepID=UPI003A9A3B92
MAAVGIVEDEKRPISTLLIFAAMDSEALPIIQHFKLSQDDGSLFPIGVPWIRYDGYYKDLHINVIYPGKDRDLGVNSVGTVPASLVTFASIQALKPDLLINAGTAGGFKVRGACISDVFLVSDLAFHHRRNPIPGPDKYCLGRRQSFPTPNLVKELNLKVCKLSTGDSLDMCPQDEICILANDATIVDMEGAALAYVSSIMRVPAIFIKVVSNYVDGEKSIPEEFAENVQATVMVLGEVVGQAVEFINGKCLFEL